MAMSVGASRSGRGGRGHRRRGRHHALVSEINVTPLVDVMLVLLIIFMVTAPLLTSTVPINLPEAGAPSAATEVKPIEVSVNKAGEIWIGDESYGITDLVPKLQAIANLGIEDQRILIKGDKTADYGTVMKVMAEIHAAGYKNIGLVGLPLQGS
jgi:biopolymer transport protein TolR